VPKDLCEGLARAISANGNDAYRLSLTAEGGAVGNAGAGWTAGGDGASGSSGAAGNGGGAPGSGGTVGSSGTQVCARNGASA